MGPGLLPLLQPGSASSSSSSSSPVPELAGGSQLRRPGPSPGAGRIKPWGSGRRAAPEPGAGSWELGAGSWELPAGAAAGSSDGDPVPLPRGPERPPDFGGAGERRHPDPPHGGRRGQAESFLRPHGARALPRPGRAGGLHGPLPRQRGDPEKPGPGRQCRAGGRGAGAGAARGPAERQRRGAAAGGDQAGAAGDPPVQGRAGQDGAEAEKRRPGHLRAAGEGQLAGGAGGAALRRPGAAARRQELRRLEQRQGAAGAEEGLAGEDRHGGAGQALPAHGHHAQGQQRPRRLRGQEGADRVAGQGRLRRPQRPPHPPLRLRGERPERHRAEGQGAHGGAGRDRARGHADHHPRCHLRAHGQAALAGAGEGDHGPLPPRPLSTGTGHPRPPRRGAAPSARAPPAAPRTPNAGSSASRHRPSDVYCGHHTQRLQDSGNQRRGVTAF